MGGNRAVIDPLAELVGMLMRAGEILDPGGHERQLLALRIGLQELELHESPVLRRVLGRLFHGVTLPGEPTAQPVAAQRLAALAAAGPLSAPEIGSLLIVLGRRSSGAARAGWCRPHPQCGSCVLADRCGHARSGPYAAHAVNRSWWRAPGEASDEELLAALLGGRSGNAHAGDLLEHPEGLRGLAQLSWEALDGVPLGSRKRLLASFELTRRWSRQVMRCGEPYRSARQVHEHLAPLVRDRGQEMLFALLLDGRNRFRRLVEVSRGTLTSSLAHPREVFGAAIREKAGALILVHNHPSGDPTPSAEDDMITERMSVVGEMVGIRLLDHVILGDGRYVSYLELGRMPTPEGDSPSFVATGDRP